jgi:hypothetical protein
MFISGVRMILYGHDSSVLQSTSNQVISDIARDFIDHLRVGGWSSPDSKPLLFLAHSLGGLILKDALVQIADARNARDRGIIDRVRGAIFFGVPNLGMEQTHLRAMVEGQPNETLIQDLSRTSGYLKRLDKSFSGISFLSRFTVFWAYEQLQSHTVVVSDHQVNQIRVYLFHDSQPRRDREGWDRKGPLETLVTVESATCRSDIHNPSFIFPIHSNHSDMVKFTRGHHYIKSVCFKIMKIVHGGSRDGPNLYEAEQSGNIQSGKLIPVSPEEAKKAETKGILLVHPLTQ